MLFLPEDISQLLQSVRFHSCYRIQFRAISHTTNKTQCTLTMQNIKYVLVLLRLSFPLIVTVAVKATIP